MSEIMIHRTRGKVVETMHRGDAVVLDPSGNVIAGCGDVYKYTYFRSSAKPIQALSVILSGARERFGIDDKELALICSSHYSEDMHLATVRSILGKLGLDESALQCGVARSIREEIAFAQTAQGIAPARIKSDCSGKHSGMLATCLIKGYPIDTYLDPAHPVQQDNLHHLAEICGYPAEQIEIGVDGCNVPVFALPIYNMALGYARFTNPEYLPEQYRDAAMTIFSAMNAFPEMVSGTGGFCTALMQATHGRLIGKVGAAGVYCIGIREPQLGIALKIEDGAPGIAPMAAMHILMSLNLITSAEYEELRHFHVQPNLNDDKLPIGELRPVFKVSGLTG